MKAVILAGGLGTRLSEETGVRPKPMVEIGGQHLKLLLLRFAVPVLDPVAAGRLEQPGALISGVAVDHSLIQEEEVQNLWRKWPTQR